MAVEAQIQAIAVHATSVTTELAKCKTAIAGERRQTIAVQQSLRRQLSASLLPLRLALGIPEAVSDTARNSAFAEELAEHNRIKRAKTTEDASTLAHASAAEAAAEAAAAATARTAAAEAATAAAAATARATSIAAATAATAARATAAAAAVAVVAAATASPRVILVTATDIRTVLEQMDMNTTPAIYDFQGRHMQSAGRRSIIISHERVIWRNGTFHLPGPKVRGGQGGSSLVVLGENVQLEDISIIGGQNGIRLMGTGGLTMRRCTVSDANYGVHVQGHSKLVADHLHVTDSWSKAFDLHDNARVEVTNCEIRGAGLDGIKATASSVMVGQRLSVVGCHREVLRLFGEARLTLKDSSLFSYPGDPGSVNQEATLVLSSCEVDGECKRGSGATIHVTNI